MKTKKAVIFIVLLSSVFLSGSKHVKAQIIVDPWPHLNLSIKSFTSSDRYPSDDLLASTPLIVIFGSECIPGSLVGCDSSTVFNLYELRYELINQNGQVFFSDRVDLYGRTGPGTLEVYPGIDVPLGAAEITVLATLYYQRGDEDKTDSATRTETVLELSQYFHYRYGFIKRHILNSGRGMPGMWLKEYEPGKDRKELLYHSRTSKFPADPEWKTRVYVPWIDKCYDFTVPANKRQTPEGGCGSSIAPGSDTIYGGNENPLLVNGLAMATFAKEYLKTGHIESLDHAIQLFRYIEQSEWIDPDGNCTGFFLRSDYPGLIKVSGEEYLFASADEIIGMTLGLYYLNEALKREPSQAPYPDVKTNVVDLVHRLGTQLKNNYYFIVPLKKVGGGQWAYMDPLPRHRHKGFVAGYTFQWFLASGFKTITWDKYQTGYRPPDEQLSPDNLSYHNFWDKVEQLTWRGEDDEINGAITAILLNKSSRDRAYLTIKGIGVGMYFSGLELPLGDITVPLPEFFDRWNFPMLLHAYQFGIADTTRPYDVRAEINRLMRELIRGVLVDGGRRMGINICDVAQGFGGGLGHAIKMSMGLDPLLYLLDILGLCEYTLPIGTPTRDMDFYAAAVALAYGLHNTYASESDRDDMWGDLSKTVINVKPWFAWDLPVGERFGPIDHNPDPKKLGTTFLWEHGVDGYQKGGKTGEVGLSNTKIEELYARGYDAMIEGGGLDFLWPDALIGSPPSDVLDWFEPVDVPFSPVCSTQARLMAPSAPATDSPCSFSFPSIEDDQFESTCSITGSPCSEDTPCLPVFVSPCPYGGFGCIVDQTCENNDSYFRAKELDFGYYDDLNIDWQIHGAYTGVDYAKYTSSGQDQTPNIYPEGDYDYYYLINDEGYDVKVDVISADGPSSCVSCHNRKVIVDGEAASLPMSITVPGKPRHTIMVKGAMGGYSINITKLVPGDLDGDGDVDRDDLNIILAARNTPADGPDDPRDLDGDGMITALDARKLVTMCTRPRCATE